MMRSSPFPNNASNQRLHVILSHVYPANSPGASVQQRQTNAMQGQGPPPKNRAFNTPSNNKWSSPSPHSLNHTLVHNLTNLLDNYKTQEKKQFLLKYFNENSLFVTDCDQFDRHTKQLKEVTTKKMVQLAKDLNQIGWDNHEHLTWYLFDYLCLADAAVMTLYGAHLVLFTGAIDKQAHPELREKYLEKARNLNIWGAYAMTEAAHGSYIRGLSTTADFDPQTDEFVINTPGLNAMKFWIGGLGFNATHAVVFARLRTNGKDHGIHTFLVPVRSLEDHRPLPGVQVGDIGQKQGRNGISNGYVLFHNVRIPRTNMLMRWSQVARDGSYTPSPKPEMSYGALISGRVAVSMSSATELKRAVTIAIRYAHTRRQFHNRVSPQQNPKDESLLINYQTMQARLIPHIAAAYAQHFGAHSLHKQNIQFLADLDELAKPNTTKKLDRRQLADLHSLAAGMKACFSAETGDAILDCRQSLGGHGYSAYAGLSWYYNDFIASITFEGENTVLLQQTARQLIKDFKTCVRGEKELHGQMKYLNNYRETLEDKCEAREFAELLDTSLLLRALKYRSTKTISDCAQQLKEYVKATNSESMAWNRTQFELVNAAKAFIDYYTALCFVKQGIENPRLPQDGKEVLSSLFNLYALQILDRDIGCMMGGFFKANQVTLIRRAFLHLCESLKEDSLNLVEGFDLPDNLMPPLGKRDCRIYENLFERVQSVEGHDQRPAYYEEVLKPRFSGTRKA